MPLAENSSSTGFAVHFYSGRCFVVHLCHDRGFAAHSSFDMTSGACSCYGRSFVGQLCSGRSFAGSGSCCLFIDRFTECIMIHAWFALFCLRLVGCQFVFLVCSILLSYFWLFQ